jgi:protein TonB
MFDQTFVDTRGEVRKPWTVAASLGLQFGLLAVILIVPLFRIGTIHFEPLVAPPVFVKLVPVPPVVERVIESAAPIRRQMQGFFDPTKVPAHALVIVDAPDSALLGPVIPSLSSVGVGAIGDMAVIKPPVVAERPRPEVQKPVEPAAPVRVSSGTQAAKLIFGPKPAYPTIAKAARVQGTVRIEAVIATNGAIRNLQVMSGPPLLVQAAVAAVQQWRYQPTLLSSVPVEVATEIDVNFTLNY